MFRVSPVRRSVPLVGIFLESVTEELWNAFVKNRSLGRKENREL
jgi:hypothetical protein